MKYKQQILASTLWLLALLLLVPQLLAIHLPQMPDSEILLCYPAYFEQAAPADQYQIEANIISSFEQALQGSDDIDDRVLYAALIASNFEEMSEGIDTLGSLAAENPLSGFAALHLLNACLGRAGHPACSADAAEQAVNLNEDNALMWSLVASMRYQQDDIDGALQALEAASTAASYDDYFQRHIELIAGALPSLGRYWNNLLPGRIINMAISVRFKNFQPVIELCAEHAGDMPSLADACMNFGSHVEPLTSNMLASGLAGAIETVTYKALGDIEEYDRREREYIRQSQARVLKLQNSGHNEALFLMSYDEQLTNFWLQNLIQFGEVAAMENLIEEAKRLSRDPQYQPCDAPALRFEFPFFYVGDKQLVF